MKTVHFAAALLALGLASCNQSAPTTPGLPTYTATLTTYKEVPLPNVPNPETPKGSAKLVWDGKKATVTGSYSGLTGAATMAHIHEGEAGQTGGPVCTLKITPDAKDATKGTLSNDGDCVLNEDKLRFGFYYVNVHTDQNKPGEIRGQLTK